MGLFHWLFKKMCGHIFNKVDRNGNNRIEEVEVEVAVYRLYNIINKRLPGWKDPPSREAIQKALQLFDTNKSGGLEKDEFVPFARSLVSDGPDMFFARVARDAVYKAAVAPLSAKGIQQLAKQAGVTKVANIPLHYLAPVADVGFRSIKALMPFGLGGR